VSNSVLDEAGDVVLYNAADGTKWVFRDDVCHGLVLRGSALFKQDQTAPAAEIKAEGRDWVARWCQSGAVCFRHDTYGLIAKVARKLLVESACCRDGEL
jgi:hypothetical protein